MENSLLQLPRTKLCHTNTTIIPPATWTRLLHFVAMILCNQAKTPNEHNIVMLSLMAAGVKAGGQWVNDRKRIGSFRWNEKLIHEEIRERSIEYFFFFYFCWVNVVDGLWWWAAINVRQRMCERFSSVVCPFLYRFFLFAFCSVLWSLLLVLALHLLHFSYRAFPCCFFPSPFYLSFKLFLVNIAVFSYLSYLSTLSLALLFLFFPTLQVSSIHCFPPSAINFSWLPANIRILP